MEEELEEQEEDTWIKNFSSAPSFKQYRDYLYFNYKPKFNGVFSRNNLPRIKDEAFVINLDEKKKSNRTHWLSLFIDKNTSVYFVSYGINYIPQEELSKIRK